MAWQNPKTDWAVNPKNPVPGDFNRIEGNIDFLKQDIETKKGVIVAAINDMNQPAEVTDTHTQLADKIRDISDDATAAVGDVEKGKTFYSGGQKRTGTLALTGNAGTGDVLSGKTFYNTALKTKRTGAMPNSGAVVITPGTSNKKIAAGYHNGQGYVEGDANLKPENIIGGESIFGVNGSLELGKKWGYGSAPVTTPTGGSSDYNSTIEIRNLNFKPNFIWLILEGMRYAHYVNPAVYPHLDRYWGNNIFLYVARNTVGSDAGAMYSLTTTIYSDGFKSLFHDGGWPEGKGFTISWLAIE